MLLLDASVWVAAVDPDDRFHVCSREIVLATERPLCALDLTVYEIGNVLGARKGEHALARRIARAIFMRAQERFIRVSPELAEQATELARRHGLTVYDAAYVAAAEASDAKLVSADIEDLVAPGHALSPDQV